MTAPRSEQPTAAIDDPAREEATEAPEAPESTESTESTVEKVDDTTVADARSESRREAAALFAQMAALPEDSPRRQAIRDELVTMHLPLVRHLARRFNNRGEPLEDLVQVATVGLINSVDRFDAERGADFLSYAVPTVVGEIKRHFRDHGWAVRVPRRLKELHLSLTAATAELSQRNGRAPNATELAEHLKLSREEVLEGLEAANAYRSSSLDDPVRGDGEMPTLAETLGDEDAALEHVEFRESLQPLLAQVPPRERKILILRFFGNMTQSQIAERMGISQMHVSRLLSQTLAKLRERLLVDE
ncbi:RNA polymerase sigma factor SigF [Cryptosporangium aurantiacum]|uniref:RNA polymerase, sigma 28 subunit, SigD/FliA/WhiG n=1 Tax=Cryptosporangium aurantiacum TaxID=134849 RepID=A0A1M7JDR1_9ACTN|nr:RNA polymerase sigma factor SigF [Cryptosporangium aurantiacum]SHM51125.1 RNA polymerase, sigma 28 subunit, SigD/FliA/WhiG [Cryptosporangium aurantiacum]